MDKIPQVSAKEIAKRLREIADEVEKNEQVVASMVSRNEFSCELFVRRDEEPYHMKLTFESVG